MDRTPDPDDLRQRIAKVLGAVDVIEGAFLFGSQAEGRARPDSDVDIGLVLREGVQPSTDLKLGLLGAFVRAGLDHVDLVFLSPDEPVTRFEAVRPNDLVYARPTFDRGTYYSRALREYWDVLPLLRWQREALKRRLQRAET